MPVQADLVTAAVLRLQDYPPFQALVLEGLIGTDAEADDSDEAKISQAWLFQGLTDDGRPYRDPEGSGTAAVVLSERTEWTGPNRHNTADFPRLQMLIYMDSSRDENGSTLMRDADAKAKHVAKILDRCFHLVANREEDQNWAGMWVHSSVRSSPRDIRDVPNTQSETVRVEMLYETVTD